MIGIFRVTYFDPKHGAINMEAFKVIAHNAEEAIKRANKRKSVKSYRVESVALIGFEDAT